MITTNINLTKLKSAVMKLKGKSGNMVECLVIPIEENKLVKGRKGGVYLGLAHFEIKEQKYGSKDTHLVKQSFDKTTREAMTDEEQKSYPILGNSVDWAIAENQNQSTEFETGDYVDANKTSEGDDLPF